MDLISISHELAHLNLGYLGIATTILLVAGSIFAYFNFNPLRERLERQEKNLESLKAEATALLEQSKIQTAESLKVFKEIQDKYQSATLQQLKETILLQTSSGIQKLENDLTEKITTVSDDKILKLKELFDSEIVSSLSKLEKDLKLELNQAKTSIDASIDQNTGKIKMLRLSAKSMRRDVKELQVAKYKQEGKMGSVLLQIELLKEYIDGGEDDAWQVPEALEVLRDNIKDVRLEAACLADIEKQLKRIAGDSQYKELIESIRANFLIKSETT